MSFIIRKPIPDDLINNVKLKQAKFVIDWIGIFIILLGIGVILTGLFTLIFSFNVSSPSFNLKF